ncbi:MAG TPA: hypothetical protein VGU45_01405 [Microvirga sp.]|jgi:hypothetical protein|nr:hypothetical protein [Microvirga sp.]
MGVAYAMIAIAVGLPTAALFGQTGWAEALIGCSVASSTAVAGAALASLWIAVPASRPVPPKLKKAGSRPKLST